MAMRDRGDPGGGGATSLFLKGVLERKAPEVGAEAMPS